MALFDLSRIEAYLAPQSWVRVVSQVGQVSLGGYRYGLGVAWAGQTVTIQFEPSAHEFVFTQVRPQKNRRSPQLELAPIRLAAQGLSIEELTGLPLALAELPTRQLMLPLLMCDPAAIEQGV